MPKDTTPSFVHEIRLNTNRFQDRKLRIKFRALRELYNTILGEILKRNGQMLQDTRYQYACFLYKKDNTDLQSIKLFDDLKKYHRLNKSDFQKKATQIKNKTYMKDHLDAHTVQMISDRAYDAYIKWCVGKRGKPRFKSWKKGVRSIQGKTHSCIIMTKKGKIKWGQLIMDCHYDKKDKYGVEAHALNSRIKYCRIVHRLVNGKDRYYVQLICEGTPLVKTNQRISHQKEVGLDIGVSTIGAVSKDKAILKPLCQELKSNQEKIHKLQRKMARSQRANNPANFENDRLVCKDKHTQKKLGTVKKGSKNWLHSKTYQKDLLELKELYRKQRDKRQYLHNKLANEVIMLGNHIKIETNNYQAWQKGWFGKTIGFRAPSNFVQTLCRKASKTGGRVEDIDAWEAKLSQACHVCHGLHKKSLKERTHKCHGKPIAQRDLYSALLALYYDKSNKQVNYHQIENDWEDLDTVLQNALLTLIKSRKSGQFVPDCLIPYQIEKRGCIQMSWRVIEQSEYLFNKYSKFNDG